MPRLSGLGLRVLRERLGRASLTGIGVALGVALFTGALLTSASVTSAFTSAFDARVTVLPVGAGPFGATVTMPASQVDVAKTLPDVESAVGALSFGTAVSTGDSATELRVNQGAPVRFVGAHPEDFTHLNIELVDGRLPAIEREVVASQSLADQLSLAVPAPAIVATPTGDQQVSIVGVVADTPDLQSAWALLSSPETAQAYTGTTDVVSFVQITLAEGMDADTWSTTHRSAFAPEGTLESAFETTLRQNVGGLSRLLLGAGVLLAILGAYLIYITVSVRVVEHMQLHGLLRAMGCTRRQLQRIVIAEGVGIGFPASVIGVLAGIGVSQLVLFSARRQLELLGGANLQLSPIPLVAGIIVGTAGATIASLIPARRAARIDPVEAIEATHARQDRPGLSPWWSVLVVIAAGLLTATDQAPIGASLLILVAVALAIPQIVRPFARVSRPFIARVFGGVGQLAIDHVQVEHRRSARTLGLLTVVLALAIAIGGIQTSGLETAKTRTNPNFADLSIIAPDAIPSAVVDQVRSTPGVAAVTGTGTITTDVITTNARFATNMQVIQPTEWIPQVGYTWVDGDAASAENALSSGGAVLAPVSAARIGIQRGSIVQLDTPHGPQTFTVAGTFESLNSILQLVISADDAKRHFGAGQPTTLTIALTDDADPNTVRQQLQETLASNSTLLVADRDDVFADVQAQLSAGTAPLFVILAVGALIGTLGLANTLAMAMMERNREIGLLRAIGARRRQLRLFALAETTTLVLAAVTIAIPAGLLLALTLLRALNDATYSTFHFHPPWGYLPLTVVASAAIAAAAALWPARHATSIDIDTVLRYE